MKIRATLIIDLLKSRSGLIHRFFFLNPYKFLPMQFILLPVSTKDYGQLSTDFDDAGLMDNYDDVHLWI